MSLNSELKKKFGNDLKEDVNLANYSWFNLGGNAQYFFKANNVNQLKEFLREAKEKDLKTNF